MQIRQPDDPGVDPEDMRVKHDLKPTWIVLGGLAILGALYALLFGV